MERESRSRIGILLAGYLCLVLNVSVFAQDVKKTVAVIDFQTTGGLSEQEAKTLTNRFRGLLVESEAFKVIEREKMNEILKEQDFTISDACNTQECAVQVGQVLGVENMIAGDIGKIGQTWTIDMRLIDVSTSNILQSKRKNYKGEIDGLLDAMGDIAADFAKTASKKSKPPKPVVTESKPVVKETVSGTPKKNSKLWWYIGGGVLVSGGLAVVLLGGGGGGAGGVSGIGDADLPSEP